MGVARKCADGPWTWKAWKDHKTGMRDHLNEIMRASECGRVQAGMPGRMAKAKLLYVVLT